MSNLLESLFVLQAEVSAINIAMLSQIITTIFRLSVPVPSVVWGTYPLVA
jgi:hypothetical protein